MVFEKCVIDQDAMSSKIHQQLFISERTSMQMQVMRTNQILLIDYVH
jgi:hypothetical protein